MGTLLANWQLNENLFGELAKCSDPHSPQPAHTPTNDIIHYVTIIKQYSYNPFYSVDIPVMDNFYYDIYIYNKVVCNITPHCNSVSPLLQYDPTIMHFIPCLSTFPDHLTHIIHGYIAGNVIPTWLRNYQGIAGKS